MTLPPNFLSTETPTSTATGDKLGAAAAAFLAANGATVPGPFSALMSSAVPSVPSASVLPASTMLGFGTGGNPAGVATCFTSLPTMGSPSASLPSPASTADQQTPLAQQLGVTLTYPSIRYTATVSPAPAQEIDSGVGNGQTTTAQTPELPTGSAAPVQTAATDTAVPLAVKGSTSKIPVPIPLVCDSPQQTDFSSVSAVAMPPGRAPVQRAEGEKVEKDSGGDSEDASDLTGDGTKSASDPISTNPSVIVYQFVAGQWMPQPPVDPAPPVSRDASTIPEGTPSGLRTSVSSVSTLAASVPSDATASESQVANAGEPATAVKPATANFATGKSISGTAARTTAVPSSNDQEGDDGDHDGSPSEIPTSRALSSPGVVTSRAATTDISLANLTVEALPVASARTGIKSAFVPAKGTKVQSQQSQSSSAGSPAVATLATTATPMAAMQTTDRATEVDGPVGSSAVSKPDQFAWNGVTRDPADASPQLASTTSPATPKASTSSQELPTGGRASEDGAAASNANPANAIAPQFGSTDTRALATSRNVSAAPEKIAASRSAGRAEFSSGVNPLNANGEKKTLTIDGKKQTAGNSNIGTDTAIRDVSMPYSVPSKTVSAESSVPAHVTSPASIQSDTTTSAASAAAPVAAAQAGRLVGEIKDIADRISSVDRNSVEVRFDFSDSDKLSVRVEYRDGTVHTTFRTDSTQVRDAISHEWTAQAGSLENKNYRVAEPVFTSNNAGQQPASSNGGGSGQSRSQEHTGTPGQTFAQTGRFSNSASTSSTATASKPTVRPETSLHLHTFA